MAAQELFTTSLFSDANLISYYRLEGNSNDAKGSNNGTDTAITYSTGNGKFGQGAGTNGSTSVIKTSLVPNYTNGTIYLWFKTSVNNQAYLCGMNTGSIGGISFLQTSADNKVSFTLNNGTNSYTLPSNSALADGNWHQVCGTWGSLGGFLYVDGVQNATDAHNYNITNQTGPIWYGGLDNNNSLNAPWSGALDDIAVFNRQLTATEVANLYNMISGAAFLQNFV